MSGGTEQQARGSVAGAGAPGDPGADGQVRTYYGQPVLSEPAWTWEVPWYLFAGGLGGAASVLAVAARATGRDVLADRALGLGAAAAVASPALLIADLGRPERFLNMLRVFRPTSAMSMGSWLLACYGALATGAAGLRWLGRFPRLQAVLEAKGAVFGAGMTTYTAVLVADSSIPVWHEARRELPWLFASSAAASAGAAAVLVSPAGEAGPARRLAIAGAAAELAAGQVMQHRLGELGEPYEEGDSGMFQKTAKACTALGGGLMVLGGRRWRALTKAGAVLLLAGGVCQRWAVYRAGFRSAADPKHVVKPQRERLDRGEGYRSAPERGRGGAPPGASPGGRTRPPAPQTTAAEPGGDAYTTAQDIEPGGDGIIDDDTVTRPSDLEPDDR